MPEYTYADVIIDPEDPRVEIGKEYYFSDDPYEVLVKAKHDDFARTLVEASSNDDYRPFSLNFSNAHFSCLIRKKEPEKKYVPFDLTKEEDRNCLKGKWLKRIDTGDEDLIISFSDDSTFIAPDQYWDAEKLLTLYVFDDGTPCGRLVEEE